LDQLTEFVTSGSRGWANYYANRGATFIRSQNIKNDWLDLSDIAFANPPPDSEGSRTLIKRGDLLLTITGANVGKCACVNSDLDKAYVSQHVALIRPVDSNLSAYLHWYLICNAGGRGQLDKQAYGAGKPGLNLEQITSVVVPIPNSNELPKLMGAIASGLETMTAQAIAIERALKQIAVQRKNILKAAFSGKLVPQDPSDEPASKLLERIRADRAARGDIGRKRSRKAKEAV
jgi:type I restriction enzyme S subunit